MRRSGEELAADVRGWAFAVEAIGDKVSTTEVTERDTWALFLIAEQLRKCADDMEHEADDYRHLRHTMQEIKAIEFVAAHERSAE